VDPNSPIAVLVVVAAFAFLIWLGLLPLWTYNRIRGIERALWAVVSQLQIQNRHSQSSGHVEQRPIDPAATNRAHEVSNSMFGR